MKILASAAAAVLLLAADVRADIAADDAERLKAAAAVLRESRANIPQEYFTRARCVAVIPGLEKAAFALDGSYGKGVVSCRAGDGWSAPVFLQLARGSSGVQVDADETGLVLLIMNEDGVQELMRESVALGAQTSIAAGPVGSETAAAAGTAQPPEILAYALAEGRLAGVDLSGGVIRHDETVNRGAYGPTATPGTILASRSISAPTAATPFIQSLGIAALAASPPPAATSTGSRSSVSTSAPADSELQRQLVAMQQIVDGMLADQSPAPVGTDARSNGGATVAVSRERLEELRTEIAALIASLSAR